MTQFYTFPLRTSLVWQDSPGCSARVLRHTDPVDTSTQENDMNATAKKLVVTVAVATITLLGFAAPAEAAKTEYKTIWCC